jgi:hypothetical protein
MVHVGFTRYNDREYVSIEELEEKGFPHLMEEQIIQEFVHRASTDEHLRKELASDPDGVIMREGFSPRVARVISRLVPHLLAGQSVGSENKPTWWSN